MDIWGAEGIEAEAELISAVVSVLKSVGLTANDVEIKVNYVWARICTTERVLTRKIPILHRLTAGSC